MFERHDSQTEHRRPTELMQRAWSVLEKLPEHEWSDARQPVLVPGGARIIERFRSQFRVIVDDPNHPQHGVASRLLGAFVACPSDEFITTCGDEKDAYLFMMGATDKEDPYHDEQPQHRVRVIPFQLISAPVTRRQFALFDPNYEHQEEDGLTRYSPKPECPAIYVSWYDAWCFARWLGADYRLPTEAQWEYACRAGGDGKWCFGSDEERLGEYAWYNEDWEKGATHPVATKQPNAWGLYDMHGNVWEWCADWFDDQYYDRSPLDNPLGPAYGSYRVYRGGSWDDAAGGCRSAGRRRSTPSGRGSYLGFRVALVPSSTSQVSQVGGAGPS